MQMNTPDANSVSLQDENVCIIENSDIVDSDCAEFSARNSKIESENIESVRYGCEENEGLSNLLAERKDKELPLDPRLIFENKISAEWEKKFDSGQFG